MDSKYFVDTNILMYAHDPSHGDKHKKARTLVEHLWRSGQGVISTQVLQELCVNLQRKVAQPLSKDEVRRLLQDYLTWEVVVNSPLSTLEAFELANQHQISFWDALILHSAETAEAAVLYSEDFSSGQHYGNVQVTNPLTR
jgi:predicted nucleic acid-binding protein